MEGEKVFKIVTPVWEKKFDASPKPFVHPFYQTMFRKLYGLTEKDAERYIGKNGPITESSDFLIPLVKKVWEENKSFVHQFYDIRTSEETGQAAPEYTILKGAGIRDISPVNIRGMGSMALPFGLQIIDTMVNVGDGALVILVDRKHDFLHEEENTACAFALYSCNDIDSQDGIWIMNYQIHLTADEMCAAVKKLKGAAIFSEVELENFSVSCKYTLCSEHGLTEPLLYLFDRQKKAGEEDILMVSMAGNTYGLVLYHVLGKEVK